MRVVGLDFGTTNSILSFHNKETDRIESFKIGGADGSSYIPSFLSIEDKEIYIGDEAKNLVTNSSAITYSKFKMLLPDDDKEKLKAYNFTDRLPKEVTKLYIETLLKTYIKEQNIDKLDSIVLTVPEIWIKDDQKARAIIKEIADELNLPLKQLISEPVAAGAYFIDNYKKHNNKPYKGHMVVFDYGGGTLDITLLEASNDKIKTLERTGKGKSGDSIGKAGVAYDELVVETLYKQTFDESLEKNCEDYHDLLIEFERKKIDSRKSIEKKISQYHKNDKLNQEIFSIKSTKGKLSITPSILVDSFEQLLSQDIISSLNEIKEYFGSYQININDHDEFRIIMVGGFSNYYLSQKSVKDFFGSQTSSDRRFENHFSLEDTALAISKGAALIANNSIQLDETYPISIGLKLYEIDGDGRKREITDIVFQKGTKVIANKIVYREELPIVSTGYITLYLDDGRINYTIKLDQDPKDLFPNHNESSNSWIIGFSVDENSFFYLHIKDKKKSKKIEVGKIMEDYKNSAIVERR